MKTVALQKHTFWQTPSLEQLRELSGVQPVRDPADLGAALWRSASELHRFIADVYAGRTADRMEGIDMRTVRPNATPGSRIRERRLQQGLTLRRVAAQVGISPSYLSDIENNKRVPAWPVLQRIASILGLDPTKLSAFGGRSRPETQQYLKARPDVARLIDAIAQARLSQAQVDRLRRAAERTSSRQPRKRL